MRVLILSKYDKKGPSSRYRSFNYAKYFRRNNIAYVFYPFMKSSYIDKLYAKNKVLLFFLKIEAIFNRFFFLLLKIKSYDLIIIEKELFPNAPYFLEAFLLRGKSYSLDFDDYVGANYKKGGLKQKILGNKIDRLAQNAKFNTVGNKWYFEEIKSSNLVYLPTVVNIKKYPFHKENWLEKKEKVIVWIGSPSTEIYLAKIFPVLEKLAQKYQFTFKIIGSNLKSDSMKIVNVAWDAKTEVDELLNSDIGIMPLENTLWEKGKCGFKLIQYMACGLPVVASPAPANEEIVMHGIHGFIAHDSEQWYSYLELLLKNDEKCANMGIEGRKRVQDHYTYQIWGDKYCEIINNSLK